MVVFGGIVETTTTRQTLVFQVQTAWADDHAREPGIGTKLSVDDIAGKDHTATSRSLSSLAGENALLIFLNRSADW